MDCVARLREGPATVAWCGRAVEPYGAQVHVLNGVLLPTLVCYLQLSPLLFFLSMQL